MQARSKEYPRQGKDWVVFPLRVSGRIPPALSSAALAAEKYTSAMICCSFIFEPGDYDDRFHALDGDIDQFARSLPGFVKTERWESTGGRFINAMYFFEDQESVVQLASYPRHRIAKDEYAKWYRSYRVDVMEVSTSYGSVPKPVLG